MCKIGGTVENPFVFSKEVGDKNGCNRKKEIKELLGFARSSQNAMIFSQRRFGKTSLIKEVLKRAKKEGILTVYVDLYAVLSEEQLVKSYSEAVSNSLLSNILKELISFLSFSISCFCFMINCLSDNIGGESDLFGMVYITIY